MIVKADSSSATPANAVVSIRCPSCRQRGTFDNFANVNDLAIGQRRLGQRRCPNDQCRAQVFFVWENQRVVASYPPERIDFDATDVPGPVVAALEEAITCQANSCYTAAAIMVRKTLEELCQDRKAGGDNLKDRIRALGTKVTLPEDLLTGLDDLRLLGNDAAHIESTAYNEVGKDEVDVGILFAKEVLKAVYQYSTLLRRLRSLKKQP